MSGASEEVTEAIVEKTEEVGTLDLSDEEFAKLNFDDIVTSEEESEEFTTEENDDNDESNKTEETSKEEENIDDEENSDEESEEESGEEEQESVSENKEVESDDEGASKTEETDEKGSDTNTEEDENSVDYEAQIKQLLSPFKANGKEIKVDNVDDAITLMQMGANYNKKMAGLKPSLKLLKMLENNDLLDESKISYLIDLDKKDPEAIKKLVKDSEIDPLDIDVKEENEYKPKSYTVNDNEVELDGILSEIRDTDSYATTVDIISNKWDDSSKHALLTNPSVIRTLNSHVQSGVYQQVNAVIESERMLGRLQDMNDIQAYQHVGKAIEANGGFTKASNETKTTNESKPAKKVDDPKLKKRKKATSSTKNTVSKKSSKEYNPLAMSDDEFEKQGNQQFL